MLVSRLLITCDEAGEPAAYARRRRDRRADRPGLDRRLPRLLEDQGNANTLRAYTNVLDRIGEQLGPGRPLAGVDDGEIGEALTTLWGEAAPSTWNRNRAAVGSWLAWCAPP
jgi:hypothetical protein